MIEEKRKYIRLSKKIGFIYKIKDIEGPKERTVTKNISPNGIQGLLNRSIKKGDWLEVAIDIPTLNKAIPLIGKVIWTAGSKAGKIDAGIKFEEIDIEMKNKFLEYICGLMFSELERLKVRYGFVRRF